jgi:ParB/RepB/Spo0J family partition protein
MPSKTIPGVKRKDISVVSDPNLIRIADGFNHRVDFNEEKMAQLVESIRQHGVRVPISVRPDKGNKDQPYILIDGERRLRAVKRLYDEGMADPPAIPCVVDHVDEDEAFINSAISNLERADINAAEEASIVQRLERIGRTPKEIAVICSRTTQWVSQRLAVASGSKALKNAVEEGDLPVDVALQVVRHVPEEKQAEVVEEALKKSNGNKSELRKEVAKKTKAKVRPKGKDLEYVQTRLNQLNSTVKAHERPALKALLLALKYCNGEIEQEALMEEAIDLLKLKAALKKSA